MSIKTRINKVLFFFLVSMVCISTGSFATHIVGGDITYKCLGNDQYEITLTVRRDCQNGALDAQFDDPATVGIFDIFGSLQPGLGDLGRLQLAFTGEDTITNSLLFDCSAVGNPVCVHESIYTGVVNLPFNKLGYKLSYQRCCRNILLNNIEEPLETGATYFTCLTTDAMNECNSQPIFNQWPDIYICANQALTFDNSAVDSDGDELVYSLCTPRQGATIDNPQPHVPSSPPYSTVVWQTPYNLNNVLGGTPLAIDPQTGQITGTPNTVGTFVVGICVEEYRDGELLSTVMRDFEYNVRICTDPIIADFEVLDNNCDGDNVVSFNNLTTGADSYVWYFDFPNTTLTSTDENPTVTYPGQGKYTVRLEATRNSDGCTTVVERIVSNSSTPLEANFDVAFESCENGNEIRLTDTSIDPTGISCAQAWTWTISSTAGTVVTEGNPSIVDVGNAQTVNITLEVVSTSGCISSVTRTVDLSDIFPAGSFTTNLVECTDNGYLIELTNTSTGIIGNTEETWTVNDNGTIINVTGSPVQLEVSNFNISVSLMVEADNGCDIDINRDVDFSDMLPVGSFTTKLIACVGDGFLIELVNTSSGISGTGDETWTINDNGTVTNLTGNPVQVEVSGDNLTVTLMALADNNCDIDFTRNVDRSEYLPSVVISSNLDGDCQVGNGPVDMILSAGLSGGNMMASPTAYAWVVNGVSYSTPTVTIPVNPGDVVNAMVTITYDNGCILSSMTQQLTSNFAPQLSINEDLDCTGDPVYTLTDVSPAIPGVSILSQQWNVNGSVTNGPSVTFPVSDVPTPVTLTVTYSNGCVSTFTNSYTIPTGGGDPMLDYSVEAVECNDSTGTFIFTNLSTYPPCVEVESVVWVINGMTYTGSPVTVVLPLGETVDFSLTITLSDGSVLTTINDGIDTNDTINTNDIVDEIEIEVENKLAANCTDSLSLCVTNPSPNVNYEWSTDPDFNNIIGTGTTLNTLGGTEYTGTIYVRTTENVGPCGYGDTTVTIDSDAINLAFDMPFIICPGDTANFMVNNNNVNQMITYEWKGGDGQLIEGADTNNPLIGMPVDETEDFFLVLCTSNDRGCTSVDTIRFEISTNEPLQPFTSTVDSCGSLTVNFDEAPNMLDGNGWWDFGDGSGLSNEMNPTYIYDMEGNYVVTLIDSSEVCPMEPVSLEIFVGDLDIFVEADTITYADDETPVVTAETNANNAMVTWCTLAGDSIYTGNPLEGYDPPMDTMTLIVKVEDSFGCTAQDTVVLIRDVDNSEECLESVNITGPDMNLVCIGDTFQLCITMADDCVLEDYTYMWEDNGCIIDGQGTPKLTATTDDDKTFNVVITSIATGQDSMYSYDVSISNPSVTITVPPENINVDGPFVCLGQSVTLTAEGDPDCEYIWSTGETGQTIEVDPSEAMTYTVICINALGCETTSMEFILNVIPPQCDESDVFLPNAFSPNGDNTNDVFQVRSKFIRSMELLVQNRWGEEVFLTTNIERGWDGTYKGKELAPDVFTYCLKVTCINDGEYVKVGNVSLMK